MMGADQERKMIYFGKSIRGVFHTIKRKLYDRRRMIPHLLHKTPHVQSMLGCQRTDVLQKKGPFYFKQRSLLLLMKLFP